MLFAIPSASFGCINAMLHQTFLFSGQLWQLFEVSQILEFLRYPLAYFTVGSCSYLYYNMSLLFYSILSHSLIRLSGTTDDFATIPFHHVLFSAALFELAQTMRHGQTITTCLFYSILSHNLGRSSGQHR